jgi:hypothetical protein
VRNVAQRDRTRTKNNFFAKNQKVKNQESKDCKKKKRKNFKNEVYQEILGLRKTDRGSKESAIYSIHLELPRSSLEPVTANTGQLWALGRSPVHLPVDASSFNEEIEPLVARRTNLLKKVRCGLNLEQR